MSRKFQIARNILIILLVVGMYMLTLMWGGGFLTKEALFEHWERINHYGPAEIILLDYTTPEGKSMVFAKYDDGVAAMGCEKEGLFWKLSNSATYVGKNDEAWKNGEGYQSGHIFAAYGWTPHKETEEVFFYLRENVIDEKHLVDSVQVDHNGFFFKSYYDEYKNKEMRSLNVMMPYLEGRDAEGNVIWRSGYYMHGSAGRYKALNVDENLKNVTPEIDIFGDRMIFDYSNTSLDIIPEGFDFEEEEGYITCLNHKFTVLSQGAMIYTGSGPEGPALEGVEPGTVFASSWT